MRTETCSVPRIGVQYVVGCEERGYNAAPAGRWARNVLVARIAARCRGGIVWVTCGIAGGGERGGGGLRSESAKVGDGLRQMLRTPAELNIEIGRGQGRAYGVLICASADLASLVRRVWWHWCRHPGGSSATEWKVGCGCQWG